MLYALATVYVHILQFDNFFLKIVGAISRTTRPIILGLFVLIKLQLSCWYQIWQWTFKFWKFLKKMFENFDVSSALNIGMERLKSGM